jgi:hypothetical protein
MVFMGVQTVSSNSYKSFYCVAPDTGSLSLPAQTKTEPHNISFSGRLLLIMRITSRTETRGHAHLVPNTIGIHF